MDAPRIATATDNGQGRFGHDITVAGHSLLADEPVSAGGQEAAPSPYDYLKVALAACTAMTLKFFAERHKIPLQHTRVDIRHDSRVQDGARMDVFTRDIELFGELTAEHRAALMQAARACPVSRTLERGSLVETAERPVLTVP